MERKSLSELKKIKEDLAKEGKRMVLCHGHFNVIHPGHLRILKFAKKKGDFLVVSILNDVEISDSVRADFFLQEERATGVESLQFVDAVHLLGTDVSHFIQEVKPDIYVKGREFEKQQEIIRQEIDAVESYGGEVIYSSGDIQYSNAKLFDEKLNQKKPNSEKVQFLEVCSKNNIDISKVKDTISNFSKLNILVIGDSIVDQFVACDMLGVSSEAPVLAIKELESKEFVGGAGIVAQHIHSLGADCTYLSVVGDDEPAKLLKKSFEERNQKYELFVDKQRPTTFKIRYIVDNQKILRVSRLQQYDISRAIEDQVVEKLEEILPQFDGVVVSDFVYGVITKRILDTVTNLAKKHGLKLFGDLQCSSQVGDVSKFEKFDLMTPTEKETRIAMKDYTSGLEKLAHNLLEKTKSNQLVITLGAQGLLAYARHGENVFSEFFPALETKPVDVAGAGDSMLSAYALGLCSGLKLEETSVLGMCAAAISINRMGNIPINSEEITHYLTELESIKRDMLLCQH